MYEPTLQAALKTASIPDFTDNVDTPVGHVKFTLSGIHIESDAVTNSSIASSAAGLSLSLSGITIAIKGHWHYREDSWPHISDSGSLDANTHGASIGATITFGATAAGQPSVHVAACTSNVGDLSVEFHGGASWLYVSQHCTRRPRNSMRCIFSSLWLDGAAAAAAAAIHSFVVFYFLVFFFSPCTDDD